MKNLIFSLLTMTLWLTSVKAMCIPENPDRCPSMGINVGLTNLDGSMNLTNVSFVGDTHANQNTNLTSLGLDLRIPSSDRVTLTLYANYLQGTETVKSLNSNTSSDLTGGNYGFNIRMYWNH